MSVDQWYFFWALKSSEFNFIAIAIAFLDYPVVEIFTKNYTLL